MIKIPLSSPEHDYEELLSVIDGSKGPQRVHNIEVIVDEEIKKHIIENFFEIDYFPSVGIDTGALRKSKTLADNDDYRRAKQNYYRMYVKFHYGMGYTIIPDHDFIINLESFNTVSLNTKDTAAFSRGDRTWAQEGRGLIKNWRDFEEFDWDMLDILLEDYGRHLDFMRTIIPDGMKIAVVGAMFYQVYAWLLGSMGLFYLIKDDFELVRSVIDRMGALTLRMYEIAASRDCVGILLHGDDLGFKTSTMISPQMLRKLVFPWYKRYSETAHKNGKRFWVHCCGFKEDIMEDLITDMNMDALHSFEDACCPVIEYKKKYGDRTGIIGGVDVDMLCRQDEEGLRKYIRKILDNCMAGGRFALGSGNSITNFVPVKNYLAMLDEANRWGVKKQYTVTSG